MSLTLKEGLISFSTFHPIISNDSLGIILLSPNFRNIWTDCGLCSVNSRGTKETPRSSWGERDYGNSTVENRVVQRLKVPTEIQKDYPNDNEPAPATLELASDVTRLLSSYLNSRWKDSPALFPSRSSDRITTQGVRDAISKIADEAGVKPYLVDGTRGEPDDVTPHALRHSVAYRMMNAEEGNTSHCCCRLQ